MPVKRGLVRGRAAKQSSLARGNKMEIQSLRLMVSEQDLNGLMVRLLPEMRKIRDLRLKLLRSGVSVSGIYQTFIGIPFETRWDLFVDEGKIAARLKSVKTAGLEMGLIKDYVMEAIASATNMVIVEGETVRFDVDLLLGKKGVPLRTNLTAVRCNEGSLLIESDTASS
jgi:hypothetical protein